MGELDRVKNFMKRAKEVEDSLVNSEPTLRVNKEAAKRTVKHALWQAAQSKKKPTHTTFSDKETYDKEDKQKVQEEKKKDEESPEKKSKFVVDQFIEMEDQ